MIDLKTIFSVSQFARQLNEHLRSQFGAVRVRGELASMTQSSSGHWYFTLKDEMAQIKAVMFRQRNVMADFSPEVGDKVEVLAQLAIYEQRGEIQLIVSVIKKAGQGTLHEQYLRLKAKLLQEGIFDSERKKRLPSIVFNLGVITSLQAAALADIRQALARRAPHVQFTVYHTAVQGDQAVGQIIDALRRADLAGHEVLILCRGGGSLEDLWSFNIEGVVRAVAACITPIVVGVGHESDVTLAEFAADLRAATPTAAAEMISRPTCDLLDQIQELHNRLRRVLRHRLEMNTQQIDRAEIGLLTPRAYVNALEVRLNHATVRLPLLAHRMVNKYFDWQLVHHRKLRENIMGAQAQAELSTQGLQNALNAFNTKRLLAVDSTLHYLGSLVEAISPQRTLERGYAFLQTETGDAVLRSVRQVKVGDHLRVTLADGELGVNINEKLSVRDSANLHPSKSR
jgi:exodeoxyribonuclease VII large subunit